MPFFSNFVRPTQQPATCVSVCGPFIALRGRLLGGQGPVVDVLVVVLVDDAHVVEHPVKLDEGLADLLGGIADVEILVQLKAWKICENERCEMVKKL